MLRIESVNVGQPTTLQVGAKATVTGIHKRPVAGRVRIGPLGLEGDHILSTKHHGGPDQAVYLYSQTDYAYWASTHGVAVAPGLFGENLTISGFAPHGVRIGDRYHVGRTVLEVSAARIPCATFAARMSDLQFVRKFTEARRPGFYARVLVPGDVAAGDAVEVEAAREDAPTLLDVFEVFHDRHASRETLEHLLRHPVAARTRAHYEARLADLPLG